MKFMYHQSISYIFDYLIIHSSHMNKFQQKLFLKAIFTILLKSFRLIFLWKIEKMLKQKIYNCIFIQIFEYLNDQIPLYSFYVSESRNAYR